LEELKEAGTTWKEIGVTMERPPHDVKRRYGELRRARADVEKKKVPEGTAAKGKGRDEGTASAGMTLPFLQADEDWSKDEVRISNSLISIRILAGKADETDTLVGASPQYRQEI
jgi:hypothetical protein